MKTIIYEDNGDKIAQVVSDSIVIKNERDALDLMVDPQLQGARKVIVDRKNIVPGFFDLSTRLAGEVLQKFVTYQVKLAIVGDFSAASPTLKDFIYETNRGTQIFFFNNIEAAKAKLFAAN